MSSSGAHNLLNAIFNSASTKSAARGALASDVAFLEEFLTATTEAAARAAIGVADFTTGDVKLSFKTSETGWVLMNDGSIGNAASGATTRANADTEDLFVLLWDNVTDTWAPVSGGRGASAAADFAADKTLTLPRTLGRTLAVSGAGSGLTSRALGEFLGAETHTLTQAETPVKSHTHTGTATSAGAHTHTVRSFDAGGASSRTASRANADLAATVDSAGTALSDGAHTHSLSINNASDATASAHNNMPPSSFLNVLIKL